MKRWLVILGAALGSVGTVGACGGGDAGKATCIEYVTAWNDCVDPADELDEDVQCNDDYFDAAKSAGCSWETYFQTCVDSLECDTTGAAPDASVVCEGGCD